MSEDSGSNIQSGKEAIIEEFVRTISDILELTYKINVIFCDGFTPMGQQARACIDISTATIYISRNYLEKMQIEEIRRIVIHEISHMFESSHNPRFKQIMTEISVGTWRPTFSSGIAIINGNDELLKVEKPEKEEQEVIDDTCCNFHDCRKTKDDVELFKCSDYCKYADECEDTVGYYCIEHVKPQRSSLDKRDRVFLEKGGHACAEFTEIDIRKEKERWEKLAHKSYG